MKGESTQRGGGRKVKETDGGVGGCGKNSGSCSWREFGSVNSSVWEESTV